MYKIIYSHIVHKVFVILDITHIPVKIRFYRGPIKLNECKLCYLKNNSNKKFEIKNKT